MKPIDIKYVGKVKGRKTHFVYEQDDNYFVFAEMEEQNRGNFASFTKKEVDNLYNELVQKSYISAGKRNAFHPKALNVSSIKYPVGSEDNHREHRLRLALYILVVLKKLHTTKDGNAIHFSDNATPDSSSERDIFLDFLRDAYSKVKRNGKGWASLGYVGAILKKDPSYQQTDYSKTKLPILIKEYRVMNQIGKGGMEIKMDLSKHSGEGG